MNILVSEYAIQSPELDNSDLSSLLSEVPLEYPMHGLVASFSFHFRK